MKKQSGFALVESLVLLVIIAAIAGVGYYVSYNKKAADSTKTTTKSSVDASLVLPKGWTLLKTNQAKRTMEFTGATSPQQYVFTVPSSLAGKVAYQAIMPAFARADYVADKDCNLAYNSMAGMEGMADTSYDGPELIIRTAFQDDPFDMRKTSTDTRTENEYYLTHKSANGNFYVDPFSGQNVYKVGQSFVSYEYIQAEKYVGTQDVSYGKVKQGPANPCYAKYKNNFETDKAQFIKIANSVK